MKPSTDKPLCVDLFCGLGGWAEGFLAEGYRCLGFDIERHDYGTGGYPGELVIQDVLTLHGKQFKDAACIVASPPCQAYSYRAMPWNPLWQENSEMDDDGAPPINHRVPDPIFNTLFAACFRIQREASEAAGHHIPLVVENVCGAQKWVGRAKWHFGSFYLWGDVPALMPITMSRKVAGFRFDGSGKSFQTASVNETCKGNTHPPKGTKNEGGSWFAVAHNTTSGHSQNPDGRKVPGIKLSDVGFNVAAAQGYREGVKQRGSGAAWFDKALDERRKSAGSKGGGDWFGRDENCSLPRSHSSRSDSRKAASAHIAKIPFPLAQHIARVFAS